MPTEPLVNRWPRRSSAGAESGQSEYDPTRPFKAGDIVTPQSINGRSFDNIARKIEGIPFRVVYDEKPSAIITIQDAEDTHYIHAAFLKLILPVEERERYSVHHSTAGIWQVIDTKDNGIISNYVDHRHPNARKAAETEAARLNAEHTANNHSTPTT